MMQYDDSQSGHVERPSDSERGLNGGRRGPVLAIIPARGGSRGIPRKNIKPLGGKPLVAWTIDAALRARSVDRVVVSTDDGEIGATARHYGADVVWRPAELSGDLASSESALLHVLETLALEENYDPEVLVFLQCTSPLTLPDDIDATVAMVLGKGFDSAVTMTPFHRFIWRETADGQWEGVNHDSRRRFMRQEREPEFLEVGAVYAMRVTGFLKHRHRFFGRIGQHTLPASRTLEIDEPHDWQLAELLIQVNGRADARPDRRPSLSEIEAVVTDFDGVMTDNRVIVDQNGVESVTCSRADGWGISMLKQAGIRVACISTEKNAVVKARCEKLGVPYWQGQENKLAALRDFLAKHGTEPRNCLYIGNDTNDADCLAYVGVAVVPRDAAADVIALAHWQTQARGGEGVLREVASRLLAERT